MSSIIEMINDFVLDANIMTGYDWSGISSIVGVMERNPDFDLTFDLWYMSDNKISSEAANLVDADSVSRGTNFSSNWRMIKLYIPASGILNCHDATTTCSMFRVMGHERFKSDSLIYKTLYDKLKLSLL